MSFKIVTAAAIATAAGVSVLALPASAGAAMSPHTVHVSASGHHGHGSHGAPVFDSIGKAVSAVAPGGTVIVDKGTYREDVAVDKPLRLQGQRGATIDATKKINGIKVTASHVTISGFEVKHATGEGILLQDVTDVTVRGNNVHTNDAGVRLKDPVPTSYEFCNPLPGGGANDCGENIHLVGSSHNVVTGNTVTDGAGGILLSDETGPTSDNLISGNRVADNHTACGIVMAGHNPKAAPNGVPARSTAGVYGNRIVGNSIRDNGLQGSGGAGVQMATAVPGGAVYENQVVGNSIIGNGHSGVTLHSHTPGQYLDGNVVTGNAIGRNNLNGDDSFSPADNQTTGVYVGSVEPLSITVRGNLIHQDKVGIFTVGPVKVAGEKFNSFPGVHTPISTH